jgi:large subunit ribosomal protein L35
MPKQKTNKSLTKRFRITGSGKLKRRKCGKRHLLGHKSGDTKRQMRQTVTFGGKLANKYIQAMGGA